MITTGVFTMPKISDQQNMSTFVISCYDEMLTDYLIEAWGAYKYEGL